jgi:recombination protein RecA
MALASKKNDKKGGKKEKATKAKVVTAGKPLARVSDTARKLVQEAMDNRFGEGTVIAGGRMGTGIYPYQLESGSLGLDGILAPVRKIVETDKKGSPIGAKWQHGITPGRIVEIYGPESTGKTTLALHFIAATQRAGGSAAFIDMEHALDPAYAKQLGVNLEELEFTQPDYGEQALEQCEMFIRSGYACIVVDSAAALVPKAELEGEMGDSAVGLQARLMSQALRKISSLLGPHKANCTVIFINQLREKIGVMFGNPETTPGGRALRFYSGTRIEVRRGDAIKLKVNDVEKQVGHRFRMKTIKNKTRPPYQDAESSLIYGHGLHVVEELYDLAEGLGLFTASGHFRKFSGTSLGNGRAACVATLQSNPQLRWAVYDAYWTKFNAIQGLHPDGSPIEGFVHKNVPTLNTTFDSNAAAAADPEPTAGEFEEDGDDVESIEGAE